ncbi:hypothetical protein OG223_50765 [Streptomyces sp. NBC_01478]|nr:hypothetical protein [Streptomyces sp. NBC_01478]
MNWVIDACSVAVWSTLLTLLYGEMTSSGCRVPGPQRSARAFGDYLRFDRAWDLLGDTGPERPGIAPHQPLSFSGSSPDFVCRSIPAPDLTIEQVVGLGVTFAREALKAHADAFGGALRADG